MGSHAYRGQVRHLCFVPAIPLDIWRFHQWGNCPRRRLENFGESLVNVTIIYAYKSFQPFRNCLTLKYFSTSWIRAFRELKGTFTIHKSATKTFQGQKIAMVITQQYYSVVTRMVVLSAGWSEDALLYAPFFPHWGQLNLCLVATHMMALSVHGVFSKLWLNLLELIICSKHIDSFACLQVQTRKVSICNEIF